MQRNRMLPRRLSQRLRILVSAFIVSLIVTACSNAFDIHPYDVKIHGEKGINAQQIATVENLFAYKDTLRIGFISDTHQWYKETRDEIEAINQRGDIDFVIHCGDLTDAGTAKEYEWSRDILSKLKVPRITLIGNHDFLGTGDQTYQVMYGPMNFSFIASRIKFVCLNTNATEYDYMAAVPDFDFMEQEATTGTELFDRTVVVMHAPPYSDQFNENVCKVFRRYLDLFPRLICCVHGHVHDPEIRRYYDDDLLFYSVDCAENRNYRIMTITPDGYEMEQIFY